MTGQHNNTFSPSHTGIPWNEKVDEAAKRAADLEGPGTSSRSLAYARHRATVQMLSDWRRLSKESPTYLGTSFLRLRALLPPKHVQPPAIKVLGGSRGAMTRFSRACLNHAPLGSYRLRFFPDEPAECPWCGVVQSRLHVLRDCTNYKRPRWWRWTAEHEFLVRKESFAELCTFLEDYPRRSPSRTLHHSWRTLTPPRLRNPTNSWAMHCPALSINLCGQKPLNRSLR
ncbi:hypothetical protein DICSQDRAFT_47142 [Dichomitus squalens LYAD-421 SS1]|uniref:uncharacterized protein n=1 Tax=Dichomitus squalens (strain LYAD-421) TaxID=732165 RepID=UPI0004410CA0|nr:uncharacterized protein DICSQDRAFT_47142 [Dichomitus squalens LYAD-421 SS1]EJF67299.1 hypothetical protein DICSQDRAFT_47142 [Dichomitus squalens LYAD-421 SS1]